jgi:hypothetical protein
LKRKSFRVISADYATYQPAMEDLVREQSSKEKTPMKRSFLKVIGLLAFSLVVMPALDQFSLNAQAREQAADVKSVEPETTSFTGKGARAIEGTWNVVVTLRDCESQAPLGTFRAMDMFIQGGSMVDTNAAPPSTRGPGFGSWEYVGEHQFTATLRFFIYNPDGTFAGVRRVAQEITMADDNNSWESTVTNIIFNPAGTPIATGCATTIAARAE